MLGTLTACGRGGAADAPYTGAPAPAADGRLFTRLPSSYTGVRFANRVVDTRELNVFTYRHFYNGGGVGIGDLNGDGRPEVMLTGSQVGNRLYLNEGQFRFRDVTAAAGIGRAGDWATGVAFADVNGDGRLDVYVGYAGKADGPRRANALYVNQGPDADGVPRLVDMARQYGVADEGYTTQAAFLDYDRDGDLDLFLVNNLPAPVTSYGPRNVRHVRDSLPGNRLLRNDRGPDGNPRFTDVSAAAGIHGTETAFGLGLTVADVNRDGWPDVYVSNDFFERDYLYLNKGDGTFADSLDRAMPVVSYFSMGNDVADVDNDGWPDVYTTDMLPEDEYRLKSTTSYEGWDQYQSKVRNGYHHQLSRNMLQRNNGDPSPVGSGQVTAAGVAGTPTFAEVGQMAGVARTDWSWGALLVDLDLDGHKDVFVTNGLAKDITSQDYVAFMANAETMRAVTAGGKGKVDFKRLTDAMSSTPIANYAFRNAGAAGGAGLRFTNEARAWGLDAPGFSSGAAYGDLDGDGAPDLVVNNVNGEAFVYRNNARALHRDRHAVRVRLDGEGPNRFGVGARVAVHAGRDAYVQEASPTRGFESSVDPVLAFGVGAHAAADSVRVDWPDGRVSVLRRATADQLLTVRQRDAAAALPARAPAPPPAPLLADATATTPLDYAHRENDFVDFDRERLIPKLVSTEGPALAVGDVNGDGLDDLYLGGANEQPKSILIQEGDGGFVRASQGAFAADGYPEDGGAAFFDADGDRDLDLYVASGGSEFSTEAPAFQDRLYLNDGRGAFTKAPPGRLPAETSSGSRVAAADYDGDGDVDVFVGGRVIPSQYGVSPASLLLVNDGRGRFTNAVARLAPELERVGMVTDAVWQDVDGDRRADLVVVGEWMPIAVFHNAGGGRLTRTAPAGLARSHGWWNRVIAGDFTGDGRVDFVVGNLGLNGRMPASDREPATMFVKDFDRNGFAEQIVACYNQGKSYPLTMRDDLVRAIPPLKARYLSYQKYALQTVGDVFPPAELAGAVERRAYTFATSLVRNDGGGRFTVVPLPAEAQLAPAYGLLADDVDGDGKADLLLGGNFDGFKPEIGRMAAGYGLLLRGDPSRCRARDGLCAPFTPARTAESGFRVPGQTRDIARVRTRRGPAYVVARNNDRALVFRPARAADAGTRLASGGR